MTLFGIGGPGDPVVMDNPGPHKGEAVRLAIRAAGARPVFLPACSPDPNPIEQAFAKLKHLLRKAKERSVEATWQRIGAILPPFTPDECSNCFTNAGYGPTSACSAQVESPDRQEHAPEQKLEHDLIAKAGPLLRIML